MNTNGSSKMVWGVVLAVSLIFCTGAEAEVELIEGKITNGVYHNEKFGWDIPVPKGWTVLSREEIQRLEGKGRKAVEEAYGTEVKGSPVSLLNLRNDRSNLFNSTAQPFDPKKDGKYKYQQKALFDMITTTYRSKGIPTDAKRSKERIDNLEFEVLKVTLYSADKKHVVLHQIIYDRLMNDRSLLMSITYNDERDGDELLKAVRSSKFRK